MYVAKSYFFLLEAPNITLDSYKHSSGANISIS